MNGGRGRNGFSLSNPAACVASRKLRDENNHPTLGFFKPRRIDRLVIAPDAEDWTQGQRQILQQKDLFIQGPEVELRKVPFVFKYRFWCDDDSCAGHELSCTDWEMGESWRTWSVKYGDRWESKFRETYETEMIEMNDTHFYVGTIHQHPGSWIIIGLFYPPRSSQPNLF